MKEKFKNVVEKKLTEIVKNHTNSLGSEHKKNKEQIDNKKVKIKKKMRYLKSSPELN